MKLTGSTKELQSGLGRPRRRLGVGKTGLLGTQTGSPWPRKDFELTQSVCGASALE